MFKMFELKEERKELLGLGPVPSGFVPLFTIQDLMKQLH